VLGSPIAHSLSPALHRAAYSALGLDWSYEPIEMAPAGMPEFLHSLDDSWAGLSLTMPLKESVQPLLAEIDALATMTRSVNTVFRGEHGWAGANTDVFGIVRSLTEAGLTSATTARVLGAGATGRSAVAALAELGISEVVVCARRIEQAEELARLGTQLGLAMRVRDLTPEPVLEDLLVSVLPGDIAGPWAGFAESEHSALLDASYHPWPSPLAAQWPGSVVANGRDMLLWQATRQVTLMTGLPAPVEAMRASLPPA
jgi:shikimate dehydrogenase